MSADVKESTELSRALALAALGCAVFPVRRDKAPYTANGLKDATADPDDARRLFEAHPDALVGVHAGRSGLLIVDVDRSESKDGFDSLTQARRTLPSTHSYRTPRGGLHAVYASTEGRPGTNVLGMPGVDIRAGESYVVWYGEVPVSREFADAPGWAILPASTPADAPTSASVVEWLEACAPGDPCERVAAFEAPAYDFGHSELCELQAHLVGLGKRGHAGVPAALDALRAEWLRDPWDTPENRRDWDESLRGAVAKYGGDPAAALCSCSPVLPDADPVTGELVEVVLDAHAEAVEAAAEKLRVSRDARRKVLVEDGGFGLFVASEVVPVDALVMLPDPPDLIDGVLGAGETQMLFGDYFTGKTYLALDWALCVATGRAWHGKAVTQGRVLYLAMEGVKTVLPRVRAWQEKHSGVAVSGFDVYPKVANFTDDESVSLLRKTVEQGGYSLVVIDTLSRSYGGGDENSAEIMGGYVGALSKVREVSPELSVLVVHHSKKDDPREYRGSTVLGAALDRIVCMVASEKNKKRPDREVEFQKVKAGGRLPESIPLRFTECGPDSILIPGSALIEPVEVELFRELDAENPGCVTRALLQETLVGRGHLNNIGTARNRVGKLIGSTFLEAVTERGKVLQLAS